MIQSVVIDNGSYLSKCGFSGNDMPISLFQTVIGKAKSNPGNKNYLIGSQLDLHSKLFSYFYPIEYGSIVESSEINCLLTEPVLNAEENREKLINIMFETYEVNRFQLAQQQLLSLYSTGATTGLVIDSGYELTQIVPINDGQIIKDGVYRHYLAGLDITKYLQQQLQKKLSISQPLIKQISQQIKETLCYVTQNYEEQQQQSNESSSGGSDIYELPDGNFLQLSEELFKTPEIMFKPNEICGKDIESIQNLIVKSVKNLDEGLQNKLYQNINLIGGNNQFPGLQERLQSEIQQLVPENQIISVYAENFKNISAWVGGSIMSQLESFNQLWISKEEYEEIGSSIISKKQL